MSIPHASHLDYALPGEVPEQLNELLAIWKRAWKDGPPNCRDLDFDVLVEHFPGLYLADPCIGGDGRASPVFLQTGPDFRQNIRGDIDGMSFSDAVYPHMLERLIDIYGRIAKTGEPHYWEIANVTSGSPTEQYHRLLLPLYDEGGKVELVIGCCAWD